MRVGIATDHGGFGLKEELVAQLRADGHNSVEQVGVRTGDCDNVVTIFEMIKP